MKITRKDTATQVVRTVQKRRLDRVSIEEHDELATEEPLEIRVEGRPVAVTMRTPGHDEELAAGFLLTEGVIARGTDVQSIAPALAKGGGVEPNVIDVRLTQAGTVDFARLTRHVFTASSCGLCGKATIAAVQARHACFEPDEGPHVTADMLARMPATLAAAQSVFLRTGGLHAAGLFATDGRLLLLREDVGRHNAVDKVIGHLALAGKIDPATLVLLVSGRVAFEIVQKALAARIAVVAAISAPTSLAADLARANGMTLVGFLREGRMNVYAGADRIIDSE
jgi:FdhD protein